MVAQFIVRIGMHENVERAVIERKPTYDIGKLHRLKRDLVAPARMGSDLSLVKATHLDLIAELRCYHFTEFPGGIATCRIEIDMRMPACAAAYEASAVGTTTCPSLTGSVVPGLKDVRKVPCLSPRR